MLGSAGSWLRCSASGSLPTTRAASLSRLRTRRQRWVRLGSSSTRPGSISAGTATERRRRQAPPPVLGTGHQVAATEFWIPLSSNRSGLRIPVTDPGHRQPGSGLRFPDSGSRPPVAEFRIRVSSHGLRSRIAVTDRGHGSRSRAPVTGQQSRIPGRASRSAVTDPRSWIPAHGSRSAVTVFGSRLPPPGLPVTDRGSLTRTRAPRHAHAPPNQAFCAEC
jgi:hypothetical protein